MSEQETTPPPVMTSTTSVSNFHVVTAVETIHRRYEVMAESPEQARNRLRRYFADPEIVADGVVRPLGEGTRERWLVRGDGPKAKK